MKKLDKTVTNPNPDINVYIVHQAVHCQGKYLWYAAHTAIYPQKLEFLFWPIIGKLKKIHPHIHRLTQSWKPD